MHSEHDDFDGTLEQLARDIDQAMLCDQQALRRALAKYRPGGKASLKQIRDRVERSVARAEQRRGSPIHIEFPPQLPICTRLEQIQTALNAHQVVIVCGETGSGKSTQLPKLCLALGRGVRGMIGHTQPRRLAARTLANRIAEELQTEVGDAVGYKIRFTDRSNPHTRIKLMTDGILLAETQADRRLDAYDTLIIDEAHERSLNIDFLLGYLTTLVQRRPELKVIITSATIDPKRFSEHFNAAPIIEVSGRTYPVEIRYRAVETDSADDTELARQQAIADTIEEICRGGPGDILVFLPGEREIRETADALQKLRLPHVEILPLYSRQSLARQNAVFRPHHERHIVLATNVAETSITVPGIRYVIDPGLARLNRYNPKTKVQRLPIEKIARSSANQRAGRCGRVSDGICIRLYTEDDYASRAAYTDPEILRTNLASVILNLAYLGLGEVGDFPFLDAPDKRQISDGYRLLQELGALDGEQRLTELGRKLARFPVDPRIARILIAAGECACLREILIIAAALSTQDPRERPLEAQQAADQAHAGFKHPKSDFLWYLNVWLAYRETASTLSGSKQRRWCKDHFLAATRMREWSDVHSQLQELVREMKLEINAAPADYDAIHQALLAGLLGNVGQRTDKGEYLGARGIKFNIFPGSFLARKPPPWLVCGELAETARLFARNVAQIEPEWIERVAPTLVRCSYHEPHWEKRPGRVVAAQKVTLYGLTLITGRKVNYDGIALEEARRIFIQKALVEHELGTELEFLSRNLELRAEVESLEHRARRLDIVVDDSTIYDFYDKLVPPHIANRTAFEKWYRDADGATRGALCLTRDLLVRDDASRVSDEDFPAALTLGDIRVPLEYHFAPDSERDGVTATVPLALANQLDPEPFDWLVPGLIHEKVTALLRALPKTIRRHFVPVPDYARACLEALVYRQGNLLEQLTAQLRRMSGITLPHDAWCTDTLPKHLSMNYRLLDDRGRPLGEGRDLKRLRTGHAEKIKIAFGDARHWHIERDNITRWDFGALPEAVKSAGGGIALTGFPGLVDEKNSVSIRVFDNAEAALQETRIGLRRLVMLSLPQEINYAAKHLAGFQQLSLHFAGIGNAEALRAQLIARIIDRTFLGEHARIRDQSAFGACLENKSRLLAVSNEVCAVVAEILEKYHALKRRLARIKTRGPMLKSLADAREHLGTLVYADFISETPERALLLIPRYLQGLSIRLDKLERDPAKDLERLRGVESYWRSLFDSGISLADAEAGRFRWMLEEYRLSVFAQELGATTAISDRRLQQQWARMRAKAS